MSLKLSGHERPSEERPSGVVHEKLTVPDVAREHGIGSVASLRPYFPGRYTGLGGARGETGPQAVAGVPTGLMPAASTRSLTTIETASPDRRSG